jgi:hypothetical protein
MLKEIANEIIKSSITDIIPFTQAEAELAGELTSYTKSLGFTIGCQGLHCYKYDS